ncbi:MAG TPA: two-component regulator propeller domain-containing protein [Bacteroidales bacterium]|nr:two-component regulator propeller domain-containing protein [Bacteroidales bacterium]
MKKRALPFCFILSLLCSLSSAENHYFRQYQVENGLSNNNVTSIIQDKHGFIWIGTRDGLNRFDGYSFHVFRETDENINPIRNNWITSLALDNDGSLWIGTFRGIYKYIEKEQSFTTIKFCEGLKADNLTFDDEGNLWCILDGKLVKYNEQLDTYQTYTIPDNGFLRSFCFTPTGIIWLTLSNGMLYSFNYPTGEFSGFDLYSHSSKNKLGDLTTVYSTMSGEKLFVGTTTNGAKIFDIQLHSYSDIMLKEIEQVEICVNDFIQASPDKVWIASENGLYIYDLSDESYILINKRQLDPYSLSTNSLFTLCKDKENGIWIGSYNGGINYYTPYQPFQKYYAYPGENALEGDIVHDIVTDKYDNLWIATEDAGLNKLEIQSGRYTHYKPQSGRHSISHKNLHGLVADDNKLWVGSIMGIDQIDIPGDKVIKHYDISSGKTIVIMKKTPGGRILVGTSNGMYAYNKANEIFESVPQFPSNIKIQSILEGKDGIIWAGTFRNGLYFYNPDNDAHGKYQYDTILLSSNNTINDIYEDSDNNLWLATQDGVKKINLNSKEVKSFTIKNGLPSNITFRILPDESNNLWISTTNGLVWLNPATSEIDVYRKEHGLITNQFNYNSSWKDKTGKMYFGMVKGMTGFYPKEVREFKTNVEIYLTNITVYDNPAGAKNTIIPVSFSNHITLGSTQSTFSIDFSSLSFIVPSITKYKYIMEGLNDNWIYIDNSRTAYFTKVPAGDYIFKVKGSDLTGAWNETPATLKITVLPPWWLSYTALAVYLLIFAFVLALIIRMTRMKNIRKFNQSIKNFEYKKEKELHEAKINFFTNIAHEIRTPLTLIIGPVQKLIHSKSLPSDAEDYISVIDKNSRRLLELVDQLLDFRKTELQGYRLNFEKREIISLLYENFNRFKDTAEQSNLSYEITTDTKLLNIFIDEDAFIKILSNLLLNAIKYAKTRIQLSFLYNESDDFFTIDVTNDGQKIPKAIREKIFEPFFRGSNAEYKSGTGLGLPLARSLAEMHKGTLVLLEREDELITFRLSLPVSQADVFNLQNDIPGKAKDVPIIKHEYTLDASRQTILIVEDNEEMKSFIGHEINLNYNVLTATNGAEALKILNEFSVQLVISDIMMPVLDGITLLKKLKTELEYSHIPVILLTAKKTIQSRLEGLEAGADAYIDKPFSVDILLAQINNLLNNRDNIRNYYLNSPITSLKSMAHTKADESFLEELNEIILMNISNTRLDVDMIADKMNLSRPTLYRKIKAISDLTPNDLIRICRLKKAAEMILEGKLSLYEISEKTGFSSQSYFSRSFSKQFEISPSEFAQKNKKRK